MTLRDRVQEIRRVRAGDLRANPRNFRRHTDAQRAALAANLNEIGYAVPVIGYETPDGVVLIDGHLRVETVAPDQEIPVVIVDVDDDEAAQLLLTIDPLAAMAETDRDTMVELMRSVESDGLATAGFFDDLIRRERLQMGEGLTDPDAVSEPPEEPVTKIGDLWLLGDHRLICGDATKAEDVDRLMNNTRADCLATSPPYWTGQEYDGKPGISGARSFMDAMIAGWADLVRRRIIIQTGHTTAEMIGESGAVFRKVLLDGMWVEALAAHSWELRHRVCWAKGGGRLNSGPLRDLIDDTWEVVLTFYRPGHNEGGREIIDGSWYQRGVWDDIVGKSFDGHPTAFPVEVAERMMLPYSILGDVVVDPFVGSGTMIVAAERLGRRCYAMEIEPRYVDVAVKRWNEYTGREAVLA